MTFINQQYAIIDQIHSISRTDGPMITVNMRGISDNKHYHTYVVKKYRNAKHWAAVTNAPGVGYIVTFLNGGLSRTGQIDADSVPLIAASAPTVEIRRVVDELHGIAPKKYKPTRAEVLAQWEKTKAMGDLLFEDAE